MDLEVNNDPDNAGPTGVETNNGEVTATENNEAYETVQTS